MLKHCSEYYLFTPYYGHKTRHLKSTSCFDQLWAGPIDDEDVGSQMQIHEVVDVVATVVLQQ